MKWIIRLLVFIACFMPVALVAALLLVVEDTPLLQGKAQMTAERIAHARQVFHQNDPRLLKAGSITQARLAQNDIALAINYAANQYAGAVADITLINGRAIINGALPLPANPLGRFLNVTLELKQTEHLPQVESLTLGKLWVPGFLAEPLLVASLVKFQPAVDWQRLQAMLNTISFEPQQMTITYQWQNQLPTQLSGALLSAADVHRLETYQRRLSGLTQRDQSPVSLVDLIRPLFQTAKARSASGDALAENRAAILVLTFYVNQWPLHRLIPQSSAWAQPVWRRVTLNGRDDFTKHYLVSAMLAAYAGTPLADAVGVYKEVDDSHGGSGFSFNDIAADRAGTRLGELASRTRLTAQNVQFVLASAAERDIMPMTADLPEFMAAADFKRRFGGIQGERYRNMMADIERRIAALPINQD